MKFRRKSAVESKISTSSMPDIIFMLLIFFMVTTVLREYSGLPVNIPKAEKIEKKMLKHAQNLEFEEAAKLRDEVQKIREYALKR